MQFNWPQTLQFHVVQLNGEILQNTFNLLLLQTRPIFFSHTIDKGRWWAKPLTKAVAKFKEDWEAWSLNSIINSLFDGSSEGSALFDTVITHWVEVGGYFPPTHYATNDALTGKKTRQGHYQSSQLATSWEIREGQWSDIDKENHFSAKAYLGCLSGCEKVHWFSQLKRWVASPLFVCGLLVGIQVMAEGVPLSEAWTNSGASTKRKLMLGQGVFDAFDGLFLLII